MKLPFKLPSMSSSPKAAEPKAGRHGKAHAHAGAVSLAGLGGKIFIAGALAMVLMAALLHWVMITQAEKGRSQQIEVIAGTLVKYVEALFQQHGATMDLLVKDPALVEVMAAGDATVISAKEAELAYLFPAAVRVRLLAPGLVDVDTSTTPHLGYACLDMLHQAEAREEAPDAEVHMFGTPQQHIDLVRRVLSPTGRRIVGVLLVSFPVQMQQQILDKLKLDSGYLELIQEADAGRELLLAARGDQAVKQGEALSRTPVFGTNWKLAYWPAEPTDTLSAADQLRFWGILGLCVVLLAVAVLVLVRLFAGALRADMIAIINLFKDTGEGHPQRHYPVKVADCRGTVELLTRMARELGGTSPAASVTSKAGKTSAPAKDALDIRDVPPAVRVGEAEPTALVNETIFRAYDIRGVVGETLTAEAVGLIGRAIGSEAAARHQHSVILARDGRLSGPELGEALSQGLRAAGMDVIDIGRVPTPLLYFATHYLGSSSGVMLTGSHNPANYNGMKIVLAGETLSGDSIQKLRSRIESDDFETGVGGMQVIDVVPDYIERVVSDVRLSRPMKVVIDCGNGVAGEIAPRLFEALGCEVIELYCDVDGNFPNHHPDPSKPDNLRDLINQVAEQGADLGLAFDGDGDRLGVVDASGRIIWPDRVMMLLAADVLSRNPGADIIYDVKCSRHLDKAIRKHGGRPLMWKTGHSLIKAKIKETGALLAGEMSGHIFFKERWFGFDDALYTGARLLEILSMDPREVSKVFAALPDSVNTPELNVEMAEGEHHRFMQRLLGSANFDDARVSTIDGLRADFDDGWGLVRASNTTPCLVLRFEADDEAGLARIQGRFRQLLLELEPGLKLPF